MLCPADGVSDAGGSLAPRILDEGVGNLIEGFLRDAADLLHSCRSVAREVAFEDLQDTARILHGFVALDLAGMSMCQHALAFLRVRHDLLRIVVAARGLLWSARPVLRLAGRLSRLPLLRHLILPARRIVRAVVWIEAGEETIKFLSVLEIVPHEKTGIGICLHVLLEVQVILQDVVDEAAQEGDISADANGHVDISHLRGTRKVRIDVNDRRAALLRCHHPAEAHGMAFSEVAALDQNAVAILHVL